jgi:hypothetical protein
MTRPWGWRRRAGAALALAGVLGGCGVTTYATRIEAWEDTLNTGKYERWRRHRLAAEDLALALRFPGFIVGLEKAPRAVLGVTGAAGCPRRELFPVEERWFRADPSDPGSALNAPLLRWAQHRLNDLRPHFVSHVVEFTHGRAVPNGRPAAEEAPFIDERMLYSVYDDRRDPARAYPFYRMGRDEGLARLRSAIAARFEAAHPPTHLLVLAVGWRMHQRESIESFNSLVGQMIRERPAERPFRPLVVGITWSSAWGVDSVAKLAYTAKANDADEIGATWGELLLRETLVPLKRRHGVPLVLVGHSLGARLLTRAAVGYPSPWRHAVDGAGRPLRRADDVDLVVSLEGAYSVRRFTTDGYEGSPYAGFRDHARKFVCVWSRHDSGSSVPTRALGLLGYPVGSEDALTITTDAAWQPRFSHFVVEAERPAGERWERVRAVQPASGDAAAFRADLANPATVAMVDASAIVRAERWGYRGGAHSDVFTPAMAALLWRCLEALTPARIERR